MTFIFEPQSMTRIEACQPVAEKELDGKVAKTAVKNCLAVSTGLRAGSSSTEIGFKPTGTRVD